MFEPVSPLSGLTAEDLYIGLADSGLRGQITVRGDLASAAVAETVQEIAGVEAPATWRLERSGERVAIWMSPDELLLLVPYMDAPASVARAGAKLAGTHHMVSDVSDARVILRLTGARVGEVLAKGIPADLSDRAFPQGSARRTHMGGLAVAVWRLEHDIWEIAAFRSYAPHLFAWLAQAAVPGSEVNA